MLALTLNDAKQMPSTRSQTRDEVQVCQKIWRRVCPSWVVIPYVTRIRFQSSENRRKPDMLLDLIKTNAVLLQKQREQTPALCCSARGEWRSGDETDPEGSRADRCYMGAAFGGGDHRPDAECNIMYILLHSVILEGGYVVYMSGNRVY